MAKSVKTLSVYVNLNTKQFTKGLRQLERRLGRLGKSMSRIGDSLTRNITMPLALAGGGAIKLASDFNESMTKIQTLVGTSGAEVENLKEKVLELAGRTAQAPRDLADGLFFIQSAGFKGKEGLEALEVSAKGAAMGMGELKDIANATTSIMTAYKSQNMSAAQAGDLLHETLKQGKFEASEFMTKIGQVLPTAAAFGISFEQLGASVATMSKLSGDAAGTLTAVNRLMMSLNAPSEQQNKTLKKLFGSYKNLNNQLKADFMGTLNKIFEGLKGNEQELVKVFGSAKAVKAAFATAGLQGDVYAEVLDGMNQSLGNVDKGFKVVSEESSFKFNKALANLKVAAIELGTTILPLATKLAEKLSDLAKGFSNMSDGARKKVIKLAATFALLGPAISIVGKLTLGVSTLLGWVRKLGVVARATSLIFALFNPYTYVFIALGAIVLGVYKNFEKLNVPLTTLINYFIEIYNEGGRLKLKIEKIGLAFGVIFDYAKFTFNFLTNGFKNLMDLLTNLMDKEKRNQAWANMMDTMADDFVTMTGDVAKRWDKFGKNFKERELKLIPETAPSDALDAGKEWAKQLIASIQDGTKNLWKGMGDFMFMPQGGGEQDWGDQSQWDGSNMYTLGTDMFGDIPEQLAETLETSKKQLTEFQLYVQEGMTKTLETMMDQISNLGFHFAESFSGMVATTLVEGNNLREAFGQFIKQMVEQVVQLIVKMLVFKAIMTALGMPMAGAMGGGGGGFSMLSSIFGFSKGGLVTGPTVGLVGEGRNVSMSNPEVIAPLSDLRKFMGGGNGRLHGTIMGSNIMLSNSRSTIVQSRVGGSVTNF